MSNKLALIVMDTHTHPRSHTHTHTHKYIERKYAVNCPAAHHRHILELTANMLIPTPLAYNTKIYEQHGILFNRINHANCNNQYIAEQNTFHKTTIINNFISFRYVETILAELTCVSVLGV